ncbi:MAG: DUF4430 domain-containing protein [Patescibacteria group bacterium]
MKNNKYFYKIISLVLLAASLAAVFTANKTQATVPPALGTYLAGVGNSDWAVMALGAMNQTPSDINFLKTIDGSSANDYATYILALTALGKDPRSFGSENLVNSLRLKATAGQLGDRAFVNDDMFGLLALVAAGVPASDALVVDEAAYIKTKQLADGSWDFAAGATQGSVDMTAMGIMALRAAGAAVSDPALNKAVAYLSNSQKDDGGWPIAPGSASNTESTAWVLSALYALGDNPDFWAPTDASPVDYLLAQIQADGHAGFDTTAKDITGRTPTTTAYAAVALAGKYYPIKILPAPTAVNIRIEGKDANICEAATEGNNALDAVKNAAAVCSYTYHIQDTQYGQYLDKINDEAAAGFVGWSFLVNNQALQVGAADYQIKSGDNILLYYGNWDDLPLRLTITPMAVVLNGSTAATVEKFDYNKNSWLAAAGAQIKRGSETIAADSGGKANLTWPLSGSFELWAQAVNMVRSAKVAITAGDSAGQQSLGLSVNIAVPTAGAAGNNPASPDSVVFGVSGDLNFGTLSAGGSATKTATLTNSGSANINTTASVSGAAVFKNNLKLDSLAVPNWQKKLNAGSQAAVDVTLSIPASYAASGQEQGSLIFWANVAP